MCVRVFLFCFSGDSSTSPDLFQAIQRNRINVLDTDEEPPAQRPRLIVLDTEDDETQDVPFRDGPDLFADESFEAPTTPPLPVNVIPLGQDEDYITHVEREIRQREDAEHAEQQLAIGYMRNLRDMFEEIDEWLNNNGGVAPFPHHFKRFMRHNWCLRLLKRKERIRINKLRYRYDMILEDEDERAETAFWDEVELNEPNTRTLNPACTICRFDLRNESFVVDRLTCGHMFHQRCLNRHLDDDENTNPRCPNCNTAVIPGARERVHFNYQ